MEWTATLGRPGLRAPSIVRDEVEAAAPEIQDGMREIPASRRPLLGLAMKQGPEIPWMVLPRAPKPVLGGLHLMAWPSTKRLPLRGVHVALELALGLWPRLKPRVAVRDEASGGRRELALYFEYSHEEPARGNRETTWATSLISAKIRAERPGSSTAQARDVEEFEADVGSVRQVLYLPEK